MKVYIVIEDNGEWYEAYEEWIVKVFSDEQNAKKFVSNSKIKVKKEQVQKSYVCVIDNCGKIFYDSASFRKHQQIHGEKHYICPYSFF